MRSALKALDKTLAFFACIFVTAFVGVVVIQVFSRTFLPRTPSWTEELARYFFIYAVAAGGGLAVRANAYVAVDILTAKIPRRFKRLHTVFINLLMCAFTAFFLIGSVFKFAFLKVRMVSTALEMPMQYVYFAMIILFGMLTLCYLIEAVLAATGNELKEAPPQ